LPAGIVSFAIFLPEENADLFELGEAIPGFDEGAVETRAQFEGRDQSDRSSSAGGRNYHKRPLRLTPAARCSANIARCTSRTTHFY